MKKLLLAGVAVAGLVAGAGAASAADLPARTAPIAPAPMIPAIPIFTWTGFYVGAQVGYAWGNSNNDVPPGAFFVNDAGFLAPFDRGFGGDNDSFMAGVHAGYNYQIGSFVVGLEGDVEGLFNDNDQFSGVLFDAAGNPVAFSLSANSIDWQGSIRARAGFAFDRALIYATGGFAFAGVSGGVSNLIANNGDDTLTGWTLGAGLEYAFTNNLTTRVEYRYTNYDLDKSTFNNVVFGDSNMDFHTVRAGVSYKF
jgi:outer membrane immunogenic protein